MMQKQSHAEKFNAISRVTAMLAHDIKNPVNNILLSTTALQETITDSEALSFLEMIKRNGNKINSMLNELLQATRFADLHISRVCITELIDEVLLAANQHLVSKNVTLKKEYPGRRSYIDADGESLKNAFRQIVLNAVESMNEDDTSLSIKVCDEQVEGETMCRVDFRDNGNGIDSSMQSLVFEPYFSTKPGKQGLGLTQAQTTILNHGGSLAVESNTG
ncbi:MAG TPA: HAMP domain-containing sensor histidine kinase, partial [Lacibacter sp.]|nr:HAMP domain-containing sensor histidine kinase [Lacibacter sp.]